MEHPRKNAKKTFSKSSAKANPVLALGPFLHTRGQGTASKKAVTKTVVGVPFLENTTLSSEEKLFIIGRVSVGDKGSYEENRWIYKLPEFQEMYAQAMKSLEKSLAKSSGGEVFLSKNIVSILSSMSGGFISYGDQSKLSHEEEVRLMHWARWSKSGEKRQIVDYFKQEWQQEEDAKRVDQEQYADALKRNIEAHRFGGLVCASCNRRYKETKDGCCASCGSMRPPLRHSGD